MLELLLGASMYIIIFVIIIVISGLIMVGTNILYDLATAIIPIVAIVLGLAGVIVGFCIAIRNTVEVYKEVYTRKGK